MYTQNKGRVQAQKELDNDELSLELGGQPHAPVCDNGRQLGHSDLVC